MKHIDVLKQLQKLTYRHTFRKNNYSQANNSTNSTKQRFHDSNKAKINKTKTIAKPTILDFLKLPNTPVNINQQDQAKQTFNNTNKAKPSLADKIYLLQPNNTAPKHITQEVASPGAYHVLNDPRPLKYPPSPLKYPPSTLKYPPSPLKYPPNYFKYPPSPLKYPPSPLKYPPSPLKFSPSPLKFSPSSLKYPPNSLKYPFSSANNPSSSSKDLPNSPKYSPSSSKYSPSSPKYSPDSNSHNPQAKGQGRSGISVSMSVSGDLDDSSISSSTDPPGVFVKSSPEDIRSRVPKPNPRRTRLPVPSAAKSLSNFLNGGSSDSIAVPHRLESTPRTKPPLGQFFSKPNRIDGALPLRDNGGPLRSNGGIIENPNGQRNTVTYGPQYPRQFPPVNGGYEDSQIRISKRSIDNMVKPKLEIVRGKRQAQEWNDERLSGAQTPYRNGLKSEQARSNGATAYPSHDFVPKQSEQSPGNTGPGYPFEDGDSHLEETGSVRSGVDKPSDGRTYTDVSRSGADKPSSANNESMSNYANDGKSNGAYFVGFKDDPHSATKNEEKTESVSTQSDETNKENGAPAISGILSLSKNSSNAYVVPLANPDSDSEQSPPFSNSSSSETPSDVFDNSPTYPPAISNTDYITPDPYTSPATAAPPKSFAPHSSPFSSPPSPPPSPPPPPPPPYSPPPPMPYLLPPLSSPPPPPPPPSPPPPPPPAPPPPPPSYVTPSSLPSAEPFAPLATSNNTPSESPSISQPSPPSATDDQNSTLSIKPGTQASLDPSSISDSDASGNQTTVSPSNPAENSNASTPASQQWRSYDDSANNSTKSGEDTLGSETDGSDFNMKTVGQLLNTTNESWNKLLSDYNMTTRPLPSNYLENKDKGGGNSKWGKVNGNGVDLDNDYNITFEKLADNLTPEPPDDRNDIKNSHPLSQASYTDLLSGSQVVVGVTNKTSPSSKDEARNANNIKEMGEIENGLNPPHLTIDDMKKRIEEFTKTGQDKQATGEKKTNLGSRGKMEKVRLIKGGHVAPMFGGDLLLAADTVKHLSQFNDYVRPAIVLEDVKVRMNKFKMHAFLYIY